MQHSLGTPASGHQGGRGSPFWFQLGTGPGAELTGGPQLGGRGAAAEPELHVAGVDHDAVVWAEVAGADDAGGTAAPHQQVVGVRGLAGFHLDAPALAPRVFVQVFLFVLVLFQGPVLPQAGRRKLASMTSSGQTVRCPSPSWHTPLPSEDSPWPLAVKAGVDSLSRFSLSHPPTLHAHPCSHACVLQGLFSLRP